MLLWYAGICIAVTALYWWAAWPTFIEVAYAWTAFPSWTYLFFMVFLMTLPPAFVFNLLLEPFEAASRRRDAW